MVGARRFQGRRLGHRGPVRPRPRGDSGSTLIEVLIAFSILFLVLTGLGFEMATQYSSVGASRNEQVGQALLDQALNDVRAMPYAVVEKGLSATDSSATGTLAYIVTTGTVWTFHDPALAGQGTGEAIAHYSPTGTTPPPPFFPHRASSTVNGEKYSVLTFPTKYGSKTTTSNGVTTVATWSSHILRVTVIVSWRGFDTPGNNGTPTTVVGQTLVYDKTAACATLGAVSSASAAPCQPDFTAAASAGNGVIALKRAVTTQAPIEGLTFTTFNLVLAGTSSTETLTQTSSVLGTAEATGATVAPASTLDQIARVVTKSTNNPAPGTSDYSTETLAQTATTVTMTSDTSSYSVTAAPSSEDTGTSVSTTSATTARSCAYFTGIVRNSTPPLPCGQGEASQAHAATLSATLSALGKVSLAVADPPGETAGDRVFTSRLAKNTNTGACTATDGCVQATARGGLGSVSLAGLPAQVATPATWRGYLVKLSGYDVTATAWARGAAGSYLSGTAKLLTTGTLSYYTQASHAYKAVSLDGAGGALTIPPLTIADGTVTVTITPTLSSGGVACSQQTPGTGSGRPHIESCVASSPLAGTIAYKITRGATTIAHFVMTVDLGLVSASTSYQVAS